MHLPETEKKKFVIDIDIQINPLKPALKVMTLERQARAVACASRREHVTSYFLCTKENSSHEKYLLALCDVSINFLDNNSMGIAKTARRN